MRIALFIISLIILLAYDSGFQLVSKNSNQLQANPQKKTEATTNSINLPPIQKRTYYFKKAEKKMKYVLFIHSGYN